MGKTYSDSPRRKLERPTNGPGGVNVLPFKGDLINILPGNDLAINSRGHVLGTTDIVDGVGAVLAPVFGGLDVVAEDDGFALLGVAGDDAADVGDGGGFGGFSGHG